MNENEFWIKIWKIVATVICAITLTAGSCSMQTKYLIAEAINNGIDPAKAECAIGGVFKENELFCSLGERK